MALTPKIKPGQVSALKAGLMAQNEKSPVKVNQTGNARSGQRYKVVTKGGRTFHDYGDGKPIEVKRFRERGKAKPRVDYFDSIG